MADSADDGGFQNDPTASEDVSPLTESFAADAANGSASFRLACRQSRGLVDQLITSASRDLRSLQPNADSSEADEEGSPSWRRRLKVDTMLLARIPRLTSLTLNGWSSEAGLVAALRQCGDAVQGGVSRLSLTGGGSLSLSSTCAVRMAFPRVCELRIGRQQDAEGYGYLRLVGPMFLPLHGANLEQVVFSQKVTTDEDVLRSLSGMSGLKKLDLHLDPMELVRSDIRAISGLSHLQHFNLRSPGGFITFDLQDVAPLFSARQLTRLQLLRVGHAGQGACLAGPAAQAMARLGGLIHLRVLDLGPVFFVDDAAFAALRRLIQLTHLSVRGMQLSNPTAGHLTLLQELTLGAHATSAALLQSLRPLLPLPALQFLRTAYTRQRLSDRGLFLDISHNGAEDSLVQAAALKAIAQHLAAAPRLRLGVEVHFTSSKGAAQQLGISELADSLIPLTGHFTRMTMRCLHARGHWQWAQLHEVVPALEQLELHSVVISSMDLGHIVQHLTALQRLALVHCMYQGTPEMYQDGWFEVAAQCSRPLLIEATPALPSANTELCRGLQQRFHGRQFIRWQ